jgi:Ca2+/Na+ antiporter
MTARNLFLAAIIAFVVMAIGSRESWAFVAFLIGMALLIMAIIRRPREKRERLVASLRDHGSNWGDGIGPSPEETGPVVPLGQVPSTLTRSYSGRSDFDVRTRRAADTAALARRGYFPTSETFIEGRWRGSDWLGAVVFLLLFLIVGLVVLAYMATNRPGGTATVFYTRNPAGSAPQGTEARPDVADRLRTLDKLRTDGLIDEAEWSDRRGGILGEI